LARQIGVAADELHPQRIDGMQGTEFPLRVPPVVRLAAELFDLAVMDVGSAVHE